MAIPETPTWMQVPVRTFPKLSTDLETEVAIIGGGIVGLLSAYVLAKAGRRVALFEKGRLASLATGYTTGFVSQLIDTDVSDLIDMYGESDTKRIWESHGEAGKLIEKIAKDEKIECEFVRCINYVYATTSRESRDLATEYKAMKKLGFPVRMGSTKPLAFEYRDLISIRGQAKYHPRKFLAGLVEALRKMDVPIYEKTEVTKIEGDGQDGQLFVLTAGTHEVRAQWTLTATYHPFNNPKEVLLKKGMYRSYIVEMEVPAGKYPEGTYEDMDNPYHYWRVDAGKGARGKDRIILGGEDHRIEVPLKKEKNFDALLQYAEDIFGKRYPVVRRWSGLIEEPIDGLAFIGEYDPRQLIATAFSGNGMTYAGISALIFRDIIAGNANALADIYRPQRMPSLTQLWKKGRDYGEEFFRGAVANALRPAE